MERAAALPHLAELEAMELMTDYETEHDYDVDTHRRRMGLASLACFAFAGIVLWWFWR